jgi:hypothetical protein
MLLLLMLLLLLEVAGFRETVVRMGVRGVDAASASASVGDSRVAAAAPHEPPLSGTVLASSSSRSGVAAASRGETGLADGVVAGSETAAAGTGEGTIPADAGGNTLDPPEGGSGASTTASDDGGAMLVGVGVGVDTESDASL